MKSLIDFFQYAIELIRIESNKKSEETEIPQSVDAIDSYLWLLEETKSGRSERAQINKDIWLQPGKIYVFKYDAKYKDFLDYWDRNPIVLALGKRKLESGSIVNVGINISWYPPKYRQEIINRIRKMYEVRYNNAMKSKPRLANAQPPVIMDLYQMKLALDTLGLSWAIRNYLPDRISQPKICICYEDWDKAVRLDQPKVYPQIEGKTTLFKVYESFKKYVLNQKNKKVEYRKKIEEAKKQNKYMFIK